MDLSFVYTKDAAIIAALNEYVQQLHYQLYPQYFKEYSYEDTFQYLSKQLESENWFCILATMNNINIGYALFYIREYKENPFRKAYKGINIDQLSVNPEYKRKGIGKAIMNEIEAFAKKNNAVQIELTHWEQNDEAKMFYEKSGFKTNMRFIVKGI
jgi:diamine N-acetyltransferase